MSSFDTISCDRCDLSAMYDPGRYQYQYDVDNNRLQIPYEAGWCHSCRNICRIEPKIDSRKVQSRVIELQREISDKKGLLRRELARFTFARRRSKIKQWKIGINKCEKELSTRLVETAIVTIMKSRQSPPRCLVCGTTDIEPLTLPSHIGIDKAYIGKVHPHCGGQLMISTGGSYSRKGLPPTITLDSEGIKIDAGQPSLDSPGHSNSDHEYMQIIADLLTLDELAQAEVGHAVNLANSLLIKRFGSVGAFQAQEGAEQSQFIGGLGRLCDDLIKESPYTAAGYELFSVWLRSLIRNDQKVSAYLSEKLQLLSRKGERFGPI